jgi:prepilin peptidase CpaA
MPGSYPLDHSLVLIFLGLVAWAAYSDALRFRIPNAVSAGLLILYPAHVLASPSPVDWLGAAAVAGGLFVVGLALFARGLAGGGDVKLLSAASLWAGPALTLPLVIVMGLTGGVLALIVWAQQYLQRYRTAGLAGLTMPPAPDAPVARVPYGVAIAAGAAYAGCQMMLG